MFYSVGITCLAPYKSKAPPSTATVWPVIIDVPTHKGPAQIGVKISFNGVGVTAFCIIFVPEKLLGWRQARAVGRQNA